VARDVNCLCAFFVHPLHQYHPGQAQFVESQSRIPIMILKAPPVPHWVKSNFFTASKICSESVGGTRPIRRADLERHVEEWDTGARIRDKKREAWFVTTGYLVRLLINHPRNSMASPFNYRRGSERSVDTDILCLLAGVF
jgi:hypothetical protein